MPEAPRPGSGAARRWWRQEPGLHLLSASIAPMVAFAVVRVPVPTLLWRTGAIGLALSLVVAALVRAVLLGRAEWRRERPATRAYLRVVARFLAAFLLVVAATS